MVLEDLIDLLNVQALALWQQEVDEQSANSAAASKEEEDPAHHFVVKMCGVPSPAVVHDLHRAGHSLCLLSHHHFYWMS